MRIVYYYQSFVFNINNILYARNILQIYKLF